ncbi:MAG: SRPBCC domain-containing protein [Gammaproteobacteria bacterium]|nr:SRPBCC domain-containing protein [Gammaproteobacteria bacterium]
MAQSEPATVIPPETSLRIRRVFNATRERIFRALIDPAELSQWFGPQEVETRDVKVDLRPGGLYSLVMHEADGTVYPLAGEYRLVEPPGRLMMTWVWGHGVLEGVETLVTFELREVRDGTELTLTHEQLPTITAREKHGDGWSSCYDKLAEFLRD